MPQFTNTETGQIIDVANSVTITENNGIYQFSLLGEPLDWPTTLVPYTPPAPPAPTLAQIQSSQISSLKSSYKTSIQSCGVTISGTDYTLALDQTNINLDIAAAFSAQEALSATPWASGVEVTVGQLCTASGTPLYCSSQGITGSSAPQIPSTIGVSVSDGSATWKVFARSAELTNGSYMWFTAAEIVSIGLQVELYLHTQKSKLIALISQVQSATTTAAVQAVTWS